MLLDIIEWSTITTLRLVGWCLAAFTLGKLVGEILGKRHQNSYVHQFLPEV